MPVQAPPANPFASALSPKDLEACVHCGICLPKCPTYLILGQEMDSPRGRLYLMRQVAEGRQPLTPRVAQHLNRCLGCLGCETACPSGVPYGRLWEASRTQLREAGVHAPGHVARGTVERFLLRTFPEPARSLRALRWLRLYQRLGAQWLVRRLGLLRPFRRLETMESILPGLPRGRRTRMPAVLPARGPPRGRAALLLGCVQRHLFPGVNEASAELLAQAGYEVLIPPEQGCCGALDAHAGRAEVAHSRARELIRALDGTDLVVTNAAGCGAAMKNYGAWLAGDEAAAFAAKVRDVTEVLAAADIPYGRLDRDVAVHDACHLAHAQRIKDAPRLLLNRIPGIRLIELQEGDVCCGSAGVYNLLEPGIAEQLGTRKADAVRATGVRLVASGNPGCSLQIARACRQQGGTVELAHPVEIAYASHMVHVAAHGGARAGAPAPRSFPE